MSCVCHTSPGGIAARPHPSSFWEDAGLESRRSFSTCLRGDASSRGSRRPPVTGQNLARCWTSDTARGPCAGHPNWPRGVCAGRTPGHHREAQHSPQSDSSGPGPAKCLVAPPFLRKHTCHVFPPRDSTCRDRTVRSRTRRCHVAVFHATLGHLRCRRDAGLGQFAIPDGRMWFAERHWNSGPSTLGQSQDDPLTSPRSCCHYGQVFGWSHGIQTLQRHCIVSGCSSGAPETPSLSRRGSCCPDFRPSAQGAHIPRARRWQRSRQTGRHCRGAPPRSPCEFAPASLGCSVGVPSCLVLC